MSDDSPLRVAIIGAGPSGFYAAGQLPGRPRVKLTEWAALREAAQQMASRR